MLSTCLLYTSFYFPTIGEYTPLLEHAGFKVVWAHLFDRWTQQSTQDGLSDWIHMFVKKPFENLSENVVTQIIQEVNEELRPVLYHIREMVALFKPVCSDNSFCVFFCKMI